MNLRIHAAAPFLFLVLLQSAPVRAAQVCDLTITACPKALPTGTLNVPLDVISLDARIPYCQETSIITSQIQPSIVFVIDNSGSMSMGFGFSDNQENDPQEARFSVVSDLLDVIKASHPGTEVGLVAFSRRLQFDHRDNPLFKTAFPNDTSQHDSYVPLIRLDQVFPGNITGLDTLKALLKHNDDGDMLYATKLAGTRTNNDQLVSTTGGEQFSMRPGTDITLGFEAAKLAMVSATAPKANQFIIFLSDGTPGGVDDGRTAVQDDFEDGLNTPTTFTVYFTGSNQAPASIQTMTTNIRNNGYSASNPQSAHYSVNAPATQLQTLLQNTILSRILTVPITGKGVTVVANGTTLNTTTKADSSTFLISGRVPLNAATTQIQLNYTHTIQDTTVKPSVLKDTVIGYTLNVARTAGAALPPNVTKTCREQASLSLLSGGLPLTTVTADHANLEARLTPVTGQTCTGCAVQVSPSASADRETIPLVPQGAFLSGSFTRAESIAPAAGDGKLQHLASDSLVLVWTNPENPLDLVRKAYPFQGIAPTLSLFHDGKELDTVTADHGLLQIRLGLPAGEACIGCLVEVKPSGSADRENVAMAGAASPYLGSFTREVAVSPAAGNGKLSHLANDSIILTYVNPLSQKSVRRAYLYVDFKNVIAVVPHNDIAKTVLTPVTMTGSQWVISDAPNLVVLPLAGGGVCCEVLPGVLNSTNPDSARFVGLKVEASREFMVEMLVFSNFGQIVNKVSFTVPRSEFIKLTPVTGKQTRAMRLLWKGLSLTGARAGTGAYVFRTTVTLLPVPGITAATHTTTTYRTMGVLRQ